MRKAASSLFIVFSASTILLLVFMDFNGIQRVPALLDYRFNRVLSALLSGAIIGLAGVLLQSSLRNPLVDHYVIGVGSGALVFTYIFILWTGGYTLNASFFSMLGGFTAMVLTILLAEKLSGSATSYILAGIGMNSVFSGLSILLSYVAVREYPYVHALLVGSFIVATAEKTQVLLIVLAVSLLTVFLIAKPLNTLEVSDEFSMVAGFNPRLTRLASVVLAGASTSIVTSMYGLIGFIGLVTPHIARYVSGTSDNRVVAPLAMLTSSAVLYLTDFISRRLFAVMWGEVPAGAVASLIGAPIFIYLLVSRRGA
ncbi:FecCD family ABC transporter permease [Desulfurococcus mucosus]|uniref:Transport system permease protein n=1 Tax=Desulfurococcus mucosus (strain ATCC 35584 / DSM 2162 / JCM 9187 / O7/1) TaxID=765177 RepID=E8R727_DESM0|nr:iron ABC transporter permease [Desulfurococcus mucosus]ADV64460.1 transport system permease protein [Desulfurococcus mucosus DSM 2162]